METKTTRVTNIILTRKWKLIGHDIGMQSARIYTTPLTWHPEGRRKEKAGVKQCDAGTQIKENTELKWNSRASARAAAKVRNRWRQFIRALCASGHEEIRWEVRWHLYSLFFLDFFFCFLFSFGICFFFCGVFISKRMISLSLIIFKFKGWIDQYF